MSARQKLNRAHFKWAILLGFFVGWLCDSFGAFIVATIFFVATAWYEGDIRADVDYQHPAPPIPPKPRLPDHQSRPCRTRRRRSRR